MLGIRAKVFFYSVKVEDRGRGEGEEADEGKLGLCPILHYLKESQGGLWSLSLPLPIIRHSGR